MKTIEKPESLEQEYRHHLPLLKDFVVKINNELQTLINNESAELGFPIQTRIKSWASISGKIKRINLKVKKIRGIQDLVGLRIVVLYKRDLESIGKVIEDRFNLIKKYDTFDRLKEDQFGYSSLHFIISIPEEWLSVPSFSQFADLRAEIQLRTMPQHIWAEVSHKLQYKKEKDVPVSLLRSIYRASALLETVDLEFERLLEDRDLYIKTLETSISTQPLNVDNLQNIFDELLPESNKSKGENYASILSELLTLNYNTTDSLKGLIETNIKYALQNDKTRVNKELLEEDEAYDEEFDQYKDFERLERGVYFTHVGLIRTILTEIHGDEYDKIQLEKIKNKI